MLVDFFSIFSGLSFLGALANALVKREFKASLARFLFRSPKRVSCAQGEISGAALIPILIEETVMRLFGKTPIALRAFLNVSLISVLFTSCYIGLASYTHGGNEFSKIAALIYRDITGSYASAGWTCAFFFVILVMDWLCFAQTFYFLRYVMIRGVYSMSFFLGTLMLC